MNDCGCFFCKDCFQDANQSTDPDSTCIICDKHKTRSFDLRDRHQLKNIEELADPIELMRKAINAIKVSHQLD